MKTLIISSIMLNVVFLTVTIYLILRYWNRIGVEIVRTYWQKKPYGIIVFLYELPLDRGFEFNRERKLFDWYWRKPKDEFVRSAK
jgi:hypothetical protein